MTRDYASIVTSSRRRSAQDMWVISVSARQANHGRDQRLGVPSSCGGPAFGIVLGEFIARGENRGEKSHRTAGCEAGRQA
jgi:hypothetical protein